MDNSSKNVVKFVVALTGAILLLMAAYYFAKARDNADNEPTVSAEEKAKAKQEEPAPPPEEDPAPDEYADEDVTAVEDSILPRDDKQPQIIEEDIQLNTGAPTLQLESAQPAPPPAPENPPQTR